MDLFLADDYSALAHHSASRDEICRDCGIPAIEYARSIDSTQRRARELASNDAADWSVVVADHQSAGRGQHGRRWAAAPGSSVLFSIVVRPANHESMSLLPLRTGLAIADALDVIIAGDADNRVYLKWPNDIIARNAKLGGILCEGQVRGDDVCAIVGVGINIRPFEHSPGVTADPECVDAIAGRLVSRIEVLCAAISAIRSGVDVVRPTLSDDELSRFASRDWLLGRAIDAPSVGTVRGINDKGHLIVQHGSGATEAVVSGSVALNESNSE